MKTVKPFKSVIRDVELLNEMEALVIRGGYTISPESTYNRDCANNCDCIKPDCPCTKTNCPIIVGGTDCQI